MRIKYQLTVKEKVVINVALRAEAADEISGVHPFFLLLRLSRLYTNLRAAAPGICWAICLRIYYLIMITRSYLFNKAVETYY